MFFLRYIFTILLSMLLTSFTGVADKTLELVPIESIDTLFKKRVSANLLASASKPAPVITIEIPNRENIYRGSAFLLCIKAAGAENFYITWQEKILQIKGVAGEAAVLLPADYYKKGDFELTIKTDGFYDYTEIITVNERMYPKTELSVDPKYVNPSPAQQKRIAQEQAKISESMGKAMKDRHWNLPFSPPVLGEVSAPFGQARVFNGEPKNRHSGTDFDASVGTPVAAIETGRVLITGDFYYAGKCVYLDHGQGVVSIYMHMSEILVKDGEWLKKGAILGKTGATGRVTGPHLHLSISVFGSMADPIPLIFYE